jgi:hypothetical protein
MEIVLRAVNANFSKDNLISYEVNDYRLQQVLEEHINIIVFRKEA